MKYECQIDPIHLAVRVQIGKGGWLDDVPQPIVRAPHTYIFDLYQHIWAAITINIPPHNHGNLVALIRTLYVHIPIT